MTGFLSRITNGMLLREINKTILIVLVICSCSRGDSSLSKEQLYLMNAAQDSALRKELFKNAQDSISKWIVCKYEDVSHLSSIKKKWALDSFIVFNGSKNRATGIILIQNDDKGEVDAAEFIDFEKKDNSWYVFLGAHMVLPRECYNKPNVQCKPIPMDTLRKEGRHYLLGIYYVKEWPWSSEYIINERWFREKMEISWDEQGKRDWITGKSRKRLTDSLPSNHLASPDN